MRQLERSREKYSTVQLYEHAAEKCKEIASIRGKKRQLQSEMAQLQKREAKSVKYHHSKPLQCKDEKSEDPRQRKLFQHVDHKNKGTKKQTDEVEIIGIDDDDTEKSNAGRNG